MEKFWDSVYLMFFIYALAAVVSLVVAWSIKLVFAVIHSREKGSKTETQAQEGVS